MAPTGTVNSRLSATLPEAEIRPAQFARLGLLNGLLIGLAVALGTWGRQALAFGNLPIAHKYGSMLLAGTAVILACSLVGWLTARLRSTVLTLVLWLVTAVALTFIIAYQPYQLQTFIAWLADSRFWGMPIYPFRDELSMLVLFSLLVASFFLVLLFGVLAIFQDARLVGVNQEREANGRLNRLAWQKLLLPLPLILLVGYITANMMGAESWRALPVVDQVITTARSYEGDLFALGLAEGVNYAAARGVREQLDGPYQLSIGAIDPLSLTTYVVATFENGAWIYCRFVNNQLTHCYDASPPYTIGLSSLITGEPLPEKCLGCNPQATEALQAWLRARQDRFGGAPVITRSGQQGDHVIMRAAAADGRYAIACWFSGSSPVVLLRCEEIN